MSRPSIAATVVRPTRATVLGGLLGGAATSAGIALTATSGWLIVRAGERRVRRNRVLVDRRVEEPEATPAA